MGRTVGESVVVSSFTSSTDVTGDSVTASRPSFDANVVVSSLFVTGALVTPASAIS